MIDNFSLLLAHGLLLLTAWRLLQRRDLNSESDADAPQPRKGWRPADDA